MTNKPEKDSLVEFTDKGLYCRKGDFYIDPWKPVHRAVITHAHSDHARQGSSIYMCHKASAPILKLRLGELSAQTLAWGENAYLNGVKVTLYPAGHIIGSSQVRLEHRGEVWVISGDYKIENDGISGAFEPVPCRHFITESTFGLPIYRWKNQQQIYTDIQDWIMKNKSDGKISVLIAYSLGKAQRVLQAIAEVSSDIFAHGAVWNVQETLKENGWAFPEVKLVTKDFNRQENKSSVIIAPPSADGTTWMKKFYPYSVGICSGWMQVRGNARRRNADMGFPLSDHADWDGLLNAVKATGAEQVYVTHGFQSVFSRYLTENGIAATEVKTQYGDDEETDKSSASRLPVDQDSANDEILPL